MFKVMFKSKKKKIDSPSCRLDCQSNIISDYDPLYGEAVEFVLKTRKASSSALQRRFGIGYQRACRIIGKMEENKIIGPANGDKPRKVFYKMPDFDNQTDK